MTAGDLRGRLSVADALKAVGLRIRGKSRADCWCDGRSTATIAFTNRVWCCHRCHAGGDIFALVQAVQQCDFKTALQFVANIAGVRLDGRPPSPVQLEQGRRDRERLARAAERLADEERRLRLAYASECRALEGLGRRIVGQLQDLGDGAERVDREKLLAALPDYARRAAAGYNVIAFAPVAERVHFLLELAARAQILETALLEGVRTSDGALVEVTA